MNNQLYNLLCKDSCNKGQAFLQKNKGLSLRDLVRKFFTDKIDFLRFVSIRQIGQRIGFDNNVKDERLLKVANALADPKENIYTAEAVIEILDRFDMED